MSIPSADMDKIWLVDPTGAAQPARVTPPPVQVGRLSVGSYEQLEKEVVNPYCDNETTPIAAGYKLGVQAVLKKLREGFVIQ